MKKIANSLIFILLTAGSLLSQAPDKFTYQAVIRNSTNDLVRNSIIGMRITLLKGSSTGTGLFVETHNPTSNSNGLISIEIGGGNVVSGSMATIDWADGPYFLKTEADPSGGTSYSITGAQQLLSVPFALYAKSSGSSIPGPKGDPGLDGKTILNGIIDPVATIGGIGDFYINTLTNTIFGPKNSNTWGTGTSLRGPQGIAGTTGINGMDGKTILNGSIDPSSTTGINGDFYINTATNKLFGPKSNGIWGVGVNLVGPTGPSGGFSITGTIGGTIYHNGTNWVLGTNLYNDGSNIGIGKVPIEKLDVDGNISLSGKINQEAWISPSLFSGWTSYGSGYSSPGYYLDKSGVVHLRGLLKDGASFTSKIFTLPVGYRPESRLIFPGICNNFWCRIDVLSNGDVYAVAGGSTGTTQFISLDGITFRVSGF